MNRFLLCLCLGLVTALSAMAQQDSSPSVNPSASPSGKNDPFGMKGFSKDRPKNARTIVTATQQATFDNANSVGQFLGGVVVQDPQFTLFCDKLTVYLNKNHKGMDHAFAEGHVIIVQDNVDDTGKPMKSIGRSGTAYFEPSTGKVTLKVWPSVQHGVDSQIATEEGTIMVLNRNGQSTTTGGSRTSITDTNGQGSGSGATPYN
jgi:hypothetical protein